jgi:transcriptional regulator with XRE-family HTH domain
MAKIFEREKAKNLRESGLSISDIASKLKVSKSTVSYWCRDIILSEAAIQKIIKSSERKSTVGILRYTESLRIERQERVLSDKRKGGTLLGKLSERDILCVGLGLYWGEGYKKGNQEFGFTNSDEKMLKFYIKWLETVFKVSKANLILRVSINELHKYRIQEVQDFWIKQTNIPIHQFTLPSFIKTQSKKIYQNHALHFGTLRIKVRLGTRLRREVLGMIEAATLVF